jgi:hypothetical protein
MAKRALVIANSQYEDGRFARLPAAKADAAALAEVLSDPEIGEFAVQQVLNAGQRAATRAIQEFFGSAQKDDLLLLHLSLHGWKDLYNRLYFVASDTERDLLEATAISADFVSERMHRSKSGQIVLLLDCCYSGAFTAGMLRRSDDPPQVDVAEPFAGKGRVVVTASTSLQFSHEADPDVRQSRDRSLPSPFTAAVVQGLAEGSADLDRDGLISVSELYDYVHEQVRQRVPGQTPTLSVDSVQGAIYLARSPRYAGSDELGELRAAVGDQQAWMRVGALHLIQRLLGSVREPVREAARQALLDLIADHDPEVAQPARRLWLDRGLGDIPNEAPRQRARATRRASTGFVAGIDFGTTNSAVGMLDHGDVSIVPNAEGALTTPSVVGLVPGGKPLVGIAAKRQAISNPEYTVSSVKLKLEDGVVRLWSPGLPGEPGRELGRHRGGPVDAVAVTRDGKVISGGYGGAWMWDPGVPDDPGRPIGRHVSEERYHLGVSAVAVTADGKVISGGGDGVVWLVDPGVPGDPGREIGRHVAAAGSSSRAVNAVAVAADGTVISGGENGAVLLWDPRVRGNHDREVGQHQHPVTAVAITSRGNIVSADRKGFVRLWERRARGYDGRELGEQGYGVTAIAIMPGGRDVLLASSSHTDTLILVALPSAS